MLKKILTHFMIFLVIVCIIVSSVVSHNEHHLKTCCEDNCSTCYIIHIAQAIISVLYSVICMMIVSFVTITIKEIKILEKEDVIKNTLLIQKTQFNE